MTIFKFKVIAFIVCFFVWLGFMFIMWAISALADTQKRILEEIVKLKKLNK